MTTDAKGRTICRTCRDDFGLRCNACTKNGCTSCSIEYSAVDPGGRKICLDCSNFGDLCATCTKTACTSCDSDAYATTNSRGQNTCTGCAEFGDACKACTKDGCTKCRIDGYMTVDSSGHKICNSCTDFGASRVSPRCATCSAKQGCLTTVPGAYVKTSNSTGLGVAVKW